MRLRHLHLPPQLVPYATAERIQETLVRQFLSSKAHPTQYVAPAPTLLTFSPHPVYTTGRRELGTTSAAQVDFLRQPLTTWDPTRPQQPTTMTAEFWEARRGGQITFHGPGQLVGYPLLDLRRVDLTSRCFVHKLETAVIDTLARYGVVGRRTEHPGVWVDDDHKIAALGVHLRRYISSHGVAINVHTDLAWFDRIVACGLEGKRTTSLLAQGACQHIADRSFVPTVPDVGRTFAAELAASLGLSGGVEDVSAEWELYQDGTYQAEELRAQALTTE